MEVGIFSFAGHGSTLDI